MCSAGLVTGCGLCTLGVSGCVLRTKVLLPTCMHLLVSGRLVVSFGSIIVSTCCLEEFPGSGLLGTVLRVWFFWLCQNSSIDPASGVSLRCSPSDPLFLFRFPESLLRPLFVAWKKSLALDYVVLRYSLGSSGSATPRPSMQSGSGGWQNIHFCVQCP